jgi:hypothetical protein
MLSFQYFAQDFFKSPLCLALLRLENLFVSQQRFQLLLAPRNSLLQLSLELA